jgi:hypothetical protein
MSDSVKVLEKALDLLELLSGSQEFMSAYEISKEIELPKSTVHRLLNTLAARGYVRKDENTFSYGIGLKILQLKDLTREHINRPMEFPSVPGWENMLHFTVPLSGRSCWHGYPMTSFKAS